MTIPLLETALTRMPALGFGTWPMRGAECQAAVESALGLGYRHVDTAEMYGNEEAVGAALAGSGLPREEIYLTTKVWNDKPKGAEIRRAAEASLERLRQPYVDLLLIHWPSPQLDLPDALHALARLREEGLARAVGVANFPPGLLRQAVEAEIAPIACLQVEHHVYLDQSRLLDYCHRQDILLTSYTPVAKGEVLRDETILEIARKHGATPGQVALAWLLGMRGVAAIPKAASPERQRENLEAVRLNLDEADRLALAALPKDRRMVNPAIAPDWES
ncbi:aldo/keto reductase [Belnapia rosea]|uniref:2,5-diketo-D-gluconate reductase B n=1 Tax=Belnapia rosea TaxID=938405 RepID=A0A1G7B7I9_9PROT|nr:aldo/keto reductase [Belnapia rosea]SDB32402.1 2,5-diketo-D-gluconate reductase B [Belnapia rosea]SDE23049.1 2,5-diketo-D-gluconate reductase B [Belnapia rosea]